MRKNLFIATKNRAIALENVAIETSKYKKCSKTKKKKTRIATYFVSTGLKNVAIGWHKSKNVALEEEKVAEEEKNVANRCILLHFFPLIQL